MSKKALTEALVDNGSYKTKTDAERAIDAVCSTITQLVTRGTPVQLRGFGNFQMKDRKARTGRNPATGEPIEIAAKSVMAFADRR